jgi:transcriptional regulator with XRE-family HTH domain
MPKTVKENLSQLVKRLVDEKHLSLGEVREKSGDRIARSYVSRIMTGNVENITLEKLLALARGLGEDPHLLLAAYCGRQPGPDIEPQEVMEWGAVEFVEMMRKVAADNKLSEIMSEATRLWPEECQVVLTFMRDLNERKQKSKRNRLPDNKTTI